MWLLLLVLIGLALHIIFKFGISTFNLKTHYNIPGLRPIPFFGNLLHLFKYGGQDYDKLCVARFGPIYSFYSGRCPIIMVSDPLVVEEILVKKSNHFVDRIKFYGVGKIMQRSLLRLRGKEWHRIRSLVSPTFTPAKLKNTIPMINETLSNILFEYFTNNSDHKSMDIKILFSNISIAIITKSILGINIDDDACLRGQFLHHAQKLLTIPVKNIWFILMNIFPELSKFIDVLHPFGIVSKDSIKFFEYQINKKISQIEKTKLNNDFLSFMVTKSGDNPSQITQEDIMAQTILLILAGFETTASTMSFLTYLLSINIDQQDDIYGDMTENICDMRNIQFEDIQKCALLESAIWEILRLYPPIDRIFRLSNSNVSLKTPNGEISNIKPETNFCIPIHLIHYNENLWNDPYTFNIHRFNSNTHNGRSSAEYLPFGLGPRHCVGQGLGILEVKIIMATLLSKHQLRAANTSPVALNFKTNALSLLNTLDDPMKVSFLERK